MPRIFRSEGDSGVVALPPVPVHSGAWLMRSHVAGMLYRGGRTRSKRSSSTSRISCSTASARLGLSMSTPNSRLPFSALQEKFALVTSRNRWSMEMNFEWLRTGRPSNVTSSAGPSPGRRCAATSSVVGDQGRGTRSAALRVQVDAHGDLGAPRSLPQRLPEPGRSLEVERRADDGVPGAVDQVGHRVRSAARCWARCPGMVHSGSTVVGRRTRALDRPQTRPMQSVVSSRAERSGPHLRTAARG